MKVVNLVVIFFWGGKRVSKWFWYYFLNGGFCFISLFFVLFCLRVIFLDCIVKYMCLLLLFYWLYLLLLLWLFYLFILLYFCLLYNGEKICFVILYFGMNLFILFVLIFCFVFFFCVKTNCIVWFQYFSYIICYFLYFI